MTKKNKTLISSFVLIVVLFFCIIIKSRSFNKNYQPHLTVIGSVFMADGLGRQAAELIEALKDDIKIGFKPRNKNVIKKGTSHTIHAILEKTNIPLGKVILYEDHLGVNGSTFQEVIKSLKEPHHIRIAYSMFESSRIPAEWVITLNHYFDAVAVPDPFLIEVYKNSGVMIPIFELPLGLNLNKFLDKPLKLSRNKPFVFANLSSTISRKNQLKLIQAFHQVFGNSLDVKLRLNGRHSEPEYSQLIKNEIYKLGMINVEFTEMCMDKELYFKTLQNVDCYVSLSLGEGFSIQPREAMALGIPIILTNNTGQATICKSDIGYNIPSLNPIPAFYPTFKNYYGTFYDCQTEDVVKALKDMYENYDFYLNQGQAARGWVKQYCYNALKPLYLSLIHPKKIVLGRENKITSDCLFTDSEELCEKFHRLLETPFERIVNNE